MSRITYGAVQHGNDTLTLTSMPEAGNYGTDGGVRYYAPAVDQAGNRYRVAWDTTQEWDTTNAAYNKGYRDFADDDAQVLADVIDEYGLDAEWVPCDPADETYACDWDSPASIEPVD